MGIWDLFDVHVVSELEGMAKPDPALPPRLTAVLPRYIYTRAQPEWRRSCSAVSSTRRESSSNPYMRVGRFRYSDFEG
ncbi:hypothetical protein SUDANB120_04767 [Streptomyces sp. enrichment culture]